MENLSKKRYASKLLVREMERGWLAAGADQNKWA